MPTDRPALRAIPIRNLDHIVLRVRDLQAMLAFHGGVPGCHVDEHNPIELKGPPA
jgi:catechol 2,3-dioxygenase-like lactoylglutathione lyase family enzyme